MALLTFDLVDRCNLKCAACYHTIYGGTSQAMDLATCEKILDHCTKNLDVKTLEAVNWGEPLLCPQLEDFVGLFTKYPGLFVTLASNMNRTVPDDTIRAILSRVNFINFSVSGIRQETYERYHRGGDIRKVMSNIERFLRIHKEVGSKTRFQWVFGQNKYNREDAEEIERFCREHGILFHPRRYYVTPIEDVCRIYEGGSVEPPVYNLFYDSLEQVREDIHQHLTPNFCGLLGDLVTDCDGNVMTCCGGKITLDTHITQIKSVEELVRVRLAHPFCRKCAEIGLSGYFRLNPKKIGYHLERGISDEIYGA